MKLKCELQTVYRSGAGTTQPSRKSQGLLVLSGRAPELLVTAYTPRNTRGLRYRVASLARVFTRHAAAGKTSLSFSQPAHDLLVSGDPVQVRAFLQQLSGLRLRRVEERLLRLTQLRALDLSGNRLTRVPAIDRRLPQLCELRLAGNLLEQLTPLAERPARSQLAYLDVSGNRLTALPESLAFLTQLHFLNAADNRLAALPDCLPSLARLRVINVANNQLMWLPAQLERMDLMELDTHGNAGEAEGERPSPGGAPSLLHLAASAVALHLGGRQLSTAELPLCVLELITQHQRCRQCGRPCFAGAGGAAAALRPGPLRHARAALVHPTGRPLPLREYTCFRCESLRGSAAGRRVR
ncbi:plant intracellular Ras-group-related LRR protein 2-like [Pollicipes pollicipes]|uniref:plant intracellular Ras-group-related LRR protein 2-like n=1 Tax=Pollicipes pollicipes TaxID=41117 RepID=UPI001884DC57|nr:plant intracellular Ras-group-related LRR protein 2-like [Pollicipes pollicipes]